MVDFIRRIWARRLARTAAVYVGAQLVSRAIPFLLLPIITRHLAPDAYGIVAMFLLATLLIEPVVGLSLSGAVGVKYFDSSTNIHAYVTAGLTVAALLSIAMLVPAVIFQHDIGRLLQIPEPWLLLVIPLAFLRTIVATVTSLLRSMGRARHYAVLQVAQTALLVVLILLLVVVLPAGWEGRITAELLALAVVAAYGIIWLRAGTRRWSIERPFVRHLFRFGAPLIPHIVGGVLIVQTDRVLLTSLVGLEQTGLYSVGYQLAVLIEIVAVAFNAAYAPWLFGKLASPTPSTRRDLVRLTYALFVVMGLLALLIAIVMPWAATTFLDARYHEAAAFVGWLALGLWFSAMYYMVTNYIYYAQKTEWLATMSLTVAVVNVPISYVLIQTNGAIGAAQATAVALWLSFALTWAFSQRVYPMPWLAALRRASEDGG